MRPRILAVAAIAAACSSFPVGTEPAVARPRRERLAIDAATLAGLPITTHRVGGWVQRTTRPREASSDAMLEGTEKESAFDSSAWNSTVGIGGGSGGHHGGRGDRAAPMRAGSTDDNAEFAGYLAYLAAARADAWRRDAFRDLDVAGRTLMHVVDRDGNPVPGTPVTIVEPREDRVAWRGCTYGDGAVPFYPALAAPAADAPMYVVEVPVGDRVVRHMWSGRADTTVRLPIARAEPILQLDVAFVIDTTGSMGDEIAAIQATLLQVTERLRGHGREFDLRYAAVLYRDLHDHYLTAAYDFTGDIAAFDDVLELVTAGGGGDTRESLNQGLAVAVDGLSWRDGAAKVAFVIGDAGPHLDYQGDVPYDHSLRAAIARGIRVHTVAASGLEPGGSVAFRQIAQVTRGEFVFLEYGGDLQKSAEAHGVATATGNNLDEILFSRIRDEVARWGRTRA